MNIPKNDNRAGTFSIFGREIYGELNLNGDKTSLKLRDEKRFEASDIPGRYIHGVLHDLSKVTLVDCNCPGTGSTSRAGSHYFSAKVFPHFVLSGEHHIVPSEECISEISIAIDDAEILFHDFDAFGSLINAEPFIDQIVRANQVDRKVETGPNPIIIYFTGRREILRAQTAYGLVTATHDPSYSLVGGPLGAKIDNTIFLNVAFENAIALKEVIIRTLTLLRYFGTIIGRPQRIVKFLLRVKSDEKRPILLDVYWSMPPEREPTHNDWTPHPSDVLLDPIQRPDEFSKVLANWLARNDAWHPARYRFFNSFSRQWTYDTDRLIGAANVFDILPPEAVPTAIELPHDLKLAKEKARALFKALEPSPERDSVLGALGRVGKSNLKQKIRFRAKSVIEAEPGLFAHLFVVLDEAVNCRNYYVHGGDSRFDYAKNSNIVHFLTDTLEFVFATSDLIEAGWNMNAWQKSRFRRHPFSMYLEEYSRNLRELRALISY